MKKITCISLLVTAIVAVWFGAAYAKSADLNTFDSLYGSSGIAGDCAVCHTSGSKVPANPYGQAYLNAGRSSAALKAIESRDSDGDGATNIAEINAGTFPGNASSKPAPPPPPPASPPVANAGPDQSVAAGALVTLSGAGSSDPDNNIASYAWSQTGGASVSLSSPSAVSTTFTAPAGSTLTFLLTVTDGGGLKATDTTVITVAAATPPPPAPTPTPTPAPTPTHPHPHPHRRRHLRLRLLPIRWNTRVGGMTRLKPVETA